ncbi:hypothetical protein B0T25DRAFT_452553 [Lasiosphaeria hispida]|uniref:USP domain-containing protein n=1 Tax=Lasiosphaeria hispida TaxID=260671 RepID=A0AAJ0MG42_9PEZI|nr:hypothetical protein B0T25DRAFT_452553 [Lasiosphaeria hispida]
MAQASNGDESRERAVSSEPCSTRPNPFDDSEISSSRKRRRTSLNGDSRSRSVETVNSSQNSLALGDLAPEARSDSAMKIDTDPTTPTTPEPQLLPSTLPPSGPRSSRVTINVRTPSRPLEVIPSSPPSPSPSPSPSPPNGPPPVLDTASTADTADAVHISVEEAELDISKDDAVVDTPVSSVSDDSSPPVEIISVQPGDDTDFDSGDPEAAILGGFPRPILQDPTTDLPFHDVAETFPDTIARITSYFPTHEMVSRNLSNWIEGFLVYCREAPYPRVVESCHDNRELWLVLPDLVMFMINRKPSLSRGTIIRQEVVGFYKCFAKLTAFFLELDLKALRSAMDGEQRSLPDFISPYYTQALGSLTRRDEFQQLNNADEPWQSGSELTDILDAFQNYHTSLGGSLVYVKHMAQALSELVPRFLRLTDQLGHLCILTSNILCLSHRRAQSLNLHAADQARGNLSRGYAFFKTISAALGSIIEKHVNHLSQDGASNLLMSLTEIYQYCLGTDRIVPADIIKEHRQSHPLIPPRNVPEAIAYHWKFTTYSKLIMSSQMQLRVMAVSAMCNDLVTFYRKCNEPSDDSSNPAFLQYVADFLLQTGLVSYILGPTCHPEITAESSNIVGFLLVSQTYTNEHTDALWQTVTSTQDPRVSDALIRMTGKITNLFSYEGLIYLCEKLNTVSVEIFSPVMREFVEAVFRHLMNKAFDRTISDAAPYDLCVRLIRQASVFGPQSPVAYPDIQQFAIQKFKDILAHGPPIECRRDIYMDCLDDISRKTPFTFGSLWVLLLMIRPNLARELHTLASEHNLTRLLVDELETAISAARSAGFSAVLTLPHSNPRKELLNFVLYHEPLTITKDLGPRLWHLLVGAGAAGREDRDVAWQLLNSACKRTHGENAFTSACFPEYLASLTPECFCLGALDFVREGVLPLVNDPTSILLDDDESADHAGIEQLWRMVLTAPEGTIEKPAIHLLVNDVYVDSRSILAFSHFRAKKVHLALVDRCLRQLSSAAARLKAFSNGTTNGDEDAMIMVATDQQVHEQELLFVRSLAILREFHRLHQAKGHFSAPDLRSLILESPNDVEGDLAELKFQSFDGDVQTEVKPLTIGKRNTAASLLASLREATGFNNYRIYYRGKPFVPQESDICKSLEDLQIHTGVILVKRESDAPTSPTTKPRPGASPVEVEILGHFEELWEYLSMEEKLAEAIYSFLVKLPADEATLKAIEDPSTSYLDIFPPGQPFRSLYAVHVLLEHLASQRHKAAAQFESYLDNPEATFSTYATSLIRAMDLVVSAISNQEVIGQCSSQERQIELGSSLMGCFVSLLKDPYLPASAAQFLDAPLLDRLVSITTLALVANAPDGTTKLAPLCLRSIFESCSVSRGFMSAFCVHAKVPRLVADVLLYDPRVAVRQIAASIIFEKISGGGTLDPDATTIKFRDFFWPLVSGLVRPAIGNPGIAAELLDLCLSMFKTLRAARSSVLDIQKHLHDWTGLLLSYITYEDLTHPEVTDVVAMTLIRLLHSILSTEEFPAPRDIFPAAGVARKIFWKHLFPPFENENRSGELIRPIINAESRSMLIEIIFALIEDDSTQLTWLLEDLNELVPVYPEEDEFYAYDLSQQFERSKAIRASCGYVGLRNLSNTCYLNSLFTQLFMNTEFRRFLLNAEVKDRNYAQNLLFQTQKLFGFMQGSIRRFISPEDCVSSIKTYEDTQIDIHNQMDVDEFYNLLIDRWEAQLLTNEEKRQFRSFYGGQLVQQVASKECDHISEILEPFSAIQCDIKGKNSLQESLQAYVDGEAMDGENKYKCSTCDLHVDAVKRACLKEIPDNLIFHLKRFEFNLRSLQRSKINDYFAFPSKIDMRPYTIDHLTDPSEGKPEDIFELVGVLVHSGTAESGHYYSYVRERPSSSEYPTWVEFNDDVVSPWDPAMMEGSCFGGPDYRTHFENNGAVYDKTYSAYMLFYQRSSSLAKGQQLLKRSGLVSPLRVELSPDLGQHIQEENLSLLRRHCLYDQSQIPFVNLALYQMRVVNQNRCTRDHTMEDLAVTMALSHLDQVASRTKDVPDFFSLKDRIDGMCQCVRCSLAVYKYFSQYSEALRMMVQKNPDNEVRQAVVDLVMRFLKTIKNGQPQHYGLPDSSEGSDGGELDPQETVMTGMMGIFRLLWDNFHVNLRSWPEVFGFMLSFVKCGRNEAAIFLEQPFLRYLLLIVWADPNLDLPPQFSRMLTSVTRRMANRPPSYEAIIGLINVLTEKARIVYSDNGEPAGPEAPEQRFDQSDDLDHPYFTRAEAKLLHCEWARGQGNIFTDKLISINQNVAAINSIIGNLIRQNGQVEEKVFRTLKNAISGQVTQHQSTPYLRVSSQVFCRVARRADLIAELINHVSQQCGAIQSIEGQGFLDFQRDVFDGPRHNSGESPEEILMGGYDDIPEWAPGLVGYSDSEVGRETEEFLREKLFQYGPSPVFEDTDPEGMRANKIVQTAKKLGIRCLVYLREHYINRRVDVTTKVLAAMERVTKECSKFYNLKDPTADKSAQEFLHLNGAVLDSLRRLTIEDLEEDGSGMFYSDSSSIASSNTAG